MNTANQNHQYSEREDRPSKVAYLLKHAFTESDNDIIFRFKILILFKEKINFVLSTMKNKERNRQKRHIYYINIYSLLSLFFPMVTLT